MLYHLHFVPLKNKREAIGGRVKIFFSLHDVLVVEIYMLVDVNYCLVMISKLRVVGLRYKKSMF